jgi:perosamine synthetase
MIDVFKKILKKLLIYPHYQMNIFCGTNTIEEFKTVLTSVLFRKNLIQGKATAIYQDDLKHYLQSDDIYTFASGRMGFYSILKAIGIQEGEEVILPSFTCSVVPNAVLYSGAMPTYCDINSKDFNIDVTQIERLITPKTRVLYAQHTFGQMCDIDAIIALAKKHNLIVVEDAALALGGRIQEKQAGTFGDFGYFSTDRSKVVNTGLGGIVTLNNNKFKKNFDTFYEKTPFLDQYYTKGVAITFLLNVLMFYPLFYWMGSLLNVILSKLNLLFYFNDENKITKPTKYHYPAKLSNILSTIGISQLKQLESNINYRRSVAHYYNGILKMYSETYINDSRNVFLRYSFLVKNRNYWVNKFSSKIDLSVWFTTIASGREHNFDEIHYGVGSNKTSEFVTKHIFNLPTHNLIKPNKLNKLLSELKQSNDIITQEYIL